MATVTWMYFGNVSPMNDSNSNSNASQNAVNSSGIVGQTYGGPDVLSPVEVSGDRVTWHSASPFFNTTYSSNNESRMDYTRPDFAGGGQVNDTNISTFLSATFKVTVADEHGNQTVLDRVGVIIQMSNGDLFMRPSLDEVPNWSGIDNLVKIQVVSATPLPKNTQPATISFNPDIWTTPIICFAAGTMIETPQGPRPVEELAAGDLLLTRDNGPQALRWVGRTSVSARKLDLLPNLRPIRIRAGALGEGAPARDLVVSPQHRILVRSKIARRMFGADEVLVAAKHLLAVDGIEVARDRERVEYVHLLLDRHEILNAEGAWAESLYLGGEARKALGPAAWREIRALFPELSEDQLAGAPARPFVSGRQGRGLSGRQQKHAQPLARAS